MSADLPIQAIRWNDRGMRRLALPASALLGSMLVAAACDEPVREPPTFTPSSGTGVTSTSGGGGMGGASSSSGTGTSSSSSSSTSTDASSSSSSSTSSNGCIPMTCTPACSGFQKCIEVTACDFQCTQGAIGDPCATTNDCVVTLVCVDNICE